MARLTQDQWNEVKAIYALGQEPVLSIAKRFGVSHTAINKKANDEKWERLDGSTVSNAIESRAALKSEVSKVSKSMKLETLHVETEIDRIASDRAKIESVGMLLVDKIAQMADMVEKPSDIQALASAHKSLYEPRFKTSPDTAIQINNNTPTRLERVVIDVSPTDSNA